MNRKQKRAGTKEENAKRKRENVFFVFDFSKYEGKVQNLQGKENIEIVRK